MSTARLAAMRRDRGSVDDGCPPCCAARHRPRKPVRTSARSGVLIGGQQRNQLRHGADEMRRVARHQDSAFDRTAPGDADVAGRQVAQAAVHELGAPPAGAEGQVVLLDQGDRQPARRGVQRDPGSGDAAADDDDVERLGRRQAPPARVRRDALSAVEFVMASGIRSVSGRVRRRARRRRGSARRSVRTGWSTG